MVGVFKIIMRAILKKRWLLVIYVDEVCLLIVLLGNFTNGTVSSTYWSLYGTGLAISVTQDNTAVIDIG